MIFVDAHVHIHECFDLDRFLRASAVNFRSAASKVGHGSGPPLLCLTECSGVNVFRHLRDEATLLDWYVVRTAESESLTLRHPRYGDLVLLAGRQIVTRERIEVLALGTDSDLPDGQGLEESVDAAHDDGAIVVLPWGFGKWSGARGQRVRSFLESEPPGRLFVGDNANRPSLLGGPDPFHFARNLGYKILPGSDPFPFEDAVDRAGRFGFMMRASVRPEYPATDLKGLLKCADRTDIIPYGRLERPIRFLINQIAMQVRKG